MLLPKPRAAGPPAFLVVMVVSPFGPMVFRQFKSTTASGIPPPYTTVMIGVIPNRMGTSSEEFREGEVRWSLATSVRP